MKHRLLSVIIIMTLVLFSCNQKNKEATINNSHMMNNDSTMMNNDTKMMHEDSNTYSCPMHPEVQGKLNDKCSKCGMKLTVPVAEASKNK